MILSLAACALAALQARAADATGVVSGRVLDGQTKLALAGARLTVEGTPIEAFSDSNGNYTITGIPAGPQTIQVGYVGYSPLSLKAQVQAGQALQLDAIFNEEVISMEKYVISGEAVGTARAINDQRSAPSLTSIVASDAVGQFPTHTVAEAASFLPGVDVSKSKGEGRFVEVRGLDPIYLGVSMNDIRLSTSEKGTREVPLDEIGSNQIATMEVVKVNTPDMDADDMGGTINIQTRSAFDHEGYQAMIGVGEAFAHQEDRKSGHSVQSYVGDTTADGRLGMFVGVSFESRPETDYAEPEASPWTLVNSPTDGQAHWMLGGQDFQHYNNTRHRDAWSASLDYKLDDQGGKAWLRYFQSYYVERVNEWITEFDYPTTVPADLLALTSTSATVTAPKGDILKEETGDENEKGEGSLVGGVEKKFGSWTNDLVTAYTYATYTRPTITIAFSNTTASNLTYNFNSSYNDSVAQVSGPSIDDPASYAFSTKSSYSATTAQMHEATVKDDLKDDFEIAGDLPSWIKIGVEARHKINGENTDKWGITSIPWTLNSSTIYPGNDVQDTAGNFPDFRILPQQIWDFQKEQPNYPLSVNVSTSYGGAFQARENILAGYGMAETTIGKLKLIAGLRDESTAFWITGWQLETTSGGALVVTPVSYDKDYSNLMPDAIATYEIDPRTTVRASWTNTIARPDYGATIPGVNVNDQVRTISQGNPELPALTSTNWDTDIEHYYSSLGYFSAGFFYKSIKNFTYQTQVGASTDPATLGYLITSYENAPTAWIYGVELAWAQRFGFLPGMLGGFGINANATIGDSGVHYPTRPGEELPYVGYAKQLGNVALSYQWGGFAAQVTESYHGKRLEVDSAIGGNSTTAAGLVIPGSTQDEYEDRYLQLGANVSYLFADHWQIYCNGYNLNNAPLKEYYGGTGGLKRMQTYEAYGWSMESGVRWTY